MRLQFLTPGNKDNVKNCYILYKNIRLWKHFPHLRLLNDDLTQIQLTGVRNLSNLLGFPGIFVQIITELLFQFFMSNDVYFILGTKN